MNPVLTDVASAFNRVATHPQSMTIDRAGVTLPEGGHFQGIQRLATAPQQVVITSSSNSQAYFVICDINADGVTGRAQPPVTMAALPLRHCGGCQTIGNILVAGVEDDDQRRVSQVQFWDLSQTPVPLGAMTIQRSGAQDVSTAGAVGLTSFGSGTALAVATWDANTIDFYASAGDPYQDSPLQLRFTWRKSTAVKTGWIDNNFGNYQSVNLLTQTDGQLFLVGFNRNGSDDWMDLFSVDLAAPPVSALRKLAKKHMYCTDGCAFDKGAGIFVPSSAAFEVYAVKGTSGDHATGTTIRANHFMAN
jgi:hypothetical protein